MYECKLVSTWVGTGTRFDRYRPLFKDEYPNCNYDMLSGNPADGTCTLHVTLIPDQTTADAIAGDERFPSWDWAEIPQG